MNLLQRLAIASLALALSGTASAVPLNKTYPAETHPLCGHKLCVFGANSTLGEMPLVSLINASAESQLADFSHRFMTPNTADHQTTNQSPWFKRSFLSAQSAARSQADSNLSSAPEPTTILLMTLGLLSLLLIRRRNRRQ